MTSKKKTFIYGTAVLTATGLLGRLIGFFYKIFLSQTIGAAEIGVFQMIVPVYTLALSLCVGGMATIMARTIAAGSIDNRKLLFCGTSVCAILALCASMLVWMFAEEIAGTFFHSRAHADILRILSWSILPSAVHSCLMSIYYARQKTVYPALSLLLEQIVRVSSSGIIYAICRRNLTQPDASLPAIALLFGELASCQFSLLVINRARQNTVHKKKSSFTMTFREYTNISRMLLRTAWPLTANRISLMLLHSIEAILIPARLMHSGATETQAYASYGVFTGMALPMILFPNTLANAASVMLLPGIAKDQAEGNHRSIARTTRLTIVFCLGSGCLAFLFFFFFGKQAGYLLFHNREAGAFLQILSFISPFLYLNATLSGILHGLGKTGSSFLINSSGLLLRILFVLGAIPVWGIRGYLYGILASELLSCSITLVILSPYYQKH